MSWSYRIAKKKKGKTTIYSLVEAYKNDKGDIWGFTGHVDSIDFIQTDDYETDEDVRDAILNTLVSVLRDIEEPFIDEDTFKFADPDFQDDLDTFQEELEAIKSDN